MLPGEAASGAGGGPRVLGGARSREALLCLALDNTVAVNCLWMPDFFKKKRPHWLHEAHRVESIAQRHGYRTI